VGNSSHWQDYTNSLRGKVNSILRYDLRFFAAPSQASDSTTEFA
jgi:hypothetical protein